jgi:single-strand DNA-binding protein
MASLNKWIGIGNVGKDPDVRSTQNGKAVASFSLACSEKWKDKHSGEMKEATEWVNCSAFSPLAEIIQKYVAKGKQIYVEGRLKTEKYEKDGQTRYSTKVVLTEMKLLGKKEGDGNGSSSQAKPANDDVDADTPF